MYLNKKQALIKAGVIIGIFILANIIFDTLYFRLDFTADKRYTLSNTTKTILKELEEPVTITAYFSEELPPQIQKFKRDFRDILTEYESYSNNKIVYKFVNPNKDAETEQATTRKGIQPILLNINKKDKFEQQKVYLGAVIQQGENSETIPALQPGAPMEYALTFAIRKTTNVEKPPIAFIKGHGEATKTQLSEVKKSLSVLYTIEEFTLTDSTQIPDKYKTIAIVNPTDSFSYYNFNELDRFLANGGNIFIGLSLVKARLQQGQGFVNHTLLENWLARKNIKIKQNFVYDANCGQVTIQQRQGNFSYNRPISFPYLPVVTNFSEHPVSKGLETILFPFISEISYTNLDTSIKVNELITTSNKSGVTPAPTYFNVMKSWTEQDFNRSNIPVAISLEGKIVGNNNSKMVIVANGDFPLNNEQGQIQGSPDNLNLLANAIDWLSDETGLSELRTKIITGYPIKEDLDEKKKTFIKYANTMFPIILLIIFGIIRFRIQNRKRKNWMENSI
ncbi:MAG: Gldg family protein [Bacteroidota bacterium]|nr:Gldg family protein [Bacteroidota bacterium]